MNPTHNKIMSLVKMNLKSKSIHRHREPHTKEVKLYLDVNVRL